MPDLSDAWLDGDATARWRSGSVLGSGAGAKAAGASLLEVDPGRRLPRHTDSAEEVVVVVAGAAEVDVEGEVSRVGPGEVALVPEDVSHEVRSVGDEALRFVAVYAGTDVVTRHEDEVQPDGSRERRPLG